MTIPRYKSKSRLFWASSGPLGDLQLSESEDESESDSPGNDDDEGDPNETKQHYQGEDEVAAKDSGLKPDSSTTAVTDPPAMLDNPRKSGWFRSRCPGQRRPANQTHTFQGQGPQQ